MNQSCVGVDKKQTDQTVFMEYVLYLGNYS